MVIVFKISEHASLVNVVRVLLKYVRHDSISHMALLSSAVTYSSCNANVKTRLQKCQKCVHVENGRQFNDFNLIDIDKNS